jgi:hypothetical protein
MPFETWFAGLTRFDLQLPNAKDGAGPVAVSQRYGWHERGRGGVTCRFPKLNFAFFEGGVGWADVFG